MSTTQNQLFGVLDTFVTELDVMWSRTLLKKSRHTSTVRQKCSNKKLLAVVKAGDACDQYPHEPNQLLSPSPRETLCIYPISSWRRRGMRGLCDTSSLPYNFRPRFPPRPLNLTAIWRFSAITIHSWVKINLWDASLGQGFEDVFSMTWAWLCAGYDNLL